MKDEIFLYLLFQVGTTWSWSFENWLIEQVHFACSHLETTNKLDILVVWSCFPVCFYDFLIYFMHHTLLKLVSF